MKRKFYDKDGILRCIEGTEGFVMEKMKEYGTLKGEAFGVSENLKSSPKIVEEKIVEKKTKKKIKEEIEDDNSSTRKLE